jgi:hypothetical protein
MSRRFQFSLKALLVVMLVVAAFFGGMDLQRRVIVFRVTAKQRAIQRDLELEAAHLRQQLRKSASEVDSLKEKLRKARLSRLPREHHDLSSAAGN